MFQSCEKPCSCVSCSPTTKNVESSKCKSEDQASPKPVAEGDVYTVACPKAELVHGWPQVASQPCGFCRWQRSLEVRRQWHGVHFCMNPSTRGNETPSYNLLTSPEAKKHVEKDVSPKNLPEVVSELSEGGWGQASGSVSSSSNNPKEGGHRKKSVRFQEPLNVGKKRSSILARFRTRSA